MGTLCRLCCSPNLNIQQSQEPWHSFFFSLKDDSKLAADHLTQTYLKHSAALASPPQQITAAHFFFSHPRMERAGAKQTSVYSGILPPSSLPLLNVSVNISVLKRNKVIKDCWEKATLRLVSTLTHFHNWRKKRKLFICWWQMRHVKNDLTWRQGRLSKWDPRFSFSRVFMCVWKSTADEEHELKVFQHIRGSSKRANC